MADPSLTSLGILTGKKLEINPNVFANPAAEYVIRETVMLDADHGFLRSDTDWILKWGPENE